MRPDDDGDADRGDARPLPLSGRQLALRAGDYAATVTGLGAALRQVTFRGQDLVGCFDEDDLLPGMRGAVLAPWPNRVADGAYQFAGTAHQLPVNDVAGRSAMHGLAFMQDFDVLARSGDAVRLRTRIAPRPGYPWRLRVDVQVSVGAEGCTQRIVATTVSTTPAPCGLGVHPYLVAGPAHEGAVDAWRLDLPARRSLRCDDRGLPIDEVAVPRSGGDGRDVSVPRRLGATVLDTAFTDLRRDDEGVARIRLTGDDGHGVEVTLGRTARRVQVFTADTLPGQERRASLAIEPMTCPPDAFNSGRDLATLEPGRSLELVWGVRRI